MNFNDADNAMNSWIALWDAIHDASRAGQPADERIGAVMQEVISGLSLYNLPYSFSDAQAAARARSRAVESLDRCLPALQHNLNR
jgi:hypothetical protein